MAPGELVQKLDEFAAEEEAAVRGSTVTRSEAARRILFKHFEEKESA